MKGLNVLSYCDGMSCGQISLSELGIKVDNYYATEIKPSAIKVTQHNFPDTKYLGDLTKVIKEDLLSLGDIDLFMSGTPCFVKGSKVLSETGYVDIESLKVGDKVFTHKGNWMSVNAIGAKLSNTITLKAQGVLPTKTTENHPYLCRNMTRVWDNPKRAYKRIFSEPTWKPAGELTKCDFIAVPRLKDESNELNLTDEDCLLIGRYIADGHTRKDYRVSEGRPNDRKWQMILSVGSHKIPEFSTKHSLHKHTKSVHRMTFSSKRLVEIVERECLCGAKNKRISPTLLKLPKDKLERLLQGIIEGDGHIIGNEVSVSTISLELAQSLCLAITKVYGVGASIYLFKKPPTCVIEERTVNQSDSYRVSFRKDVQKQTKYHVCEDYVWFPVRSVEENDGKEFVYNIEVDQDNTYSVNNAIVHNCKDFSQANRVRLGLSGEKSGLFFNFLEALNIVKPKYFFFENVKMSKEDMNEISLALGVEPVRVNSKLKTGALRDRFYWTNIPFVGTFEDKNILLQDVLESGWTDRDKARCLLESDSRPLSTHVKMFHRHHSTGFTTPIFKSKEHYDSCVKHYEENFKGLSASEIKYDGDVYDGIRYLTKVEREKLQGVPVGYTSILTDNESAGLLGDGWTVSVVKEFFKGLV